MARWVRVLDQKSVATRSPLPPAHSPPPSAGSKLTRNVTLCARKQTCRAWQAVKRRRAPLGRMSRQRADELAQSARVERSGSGALAARARVRDARQTIRVEPMRGSRRTGTGAFLGRWISCVGLPLLSCVGVGPI
eukprot:6192207-Pleurochrysis_carterae.AAC.1